VLSIRTLPEAGYPNPEDWFSPDQKYAELRSDDVSRAPNPVYASVRSLFEQAALDAPHAGTPEWNPLGGFVRPGARVFVLCNFVYHRRPQESELHLHGKCIHGSVLRALIDYLLIAVGPSGRVTFGNAPLQACSWTRVLEETGAARALEFYRSRGLPVEARDLRLLVAERDVLGRVVSVEHRDEAEHAVEIDLSAESLLSELAGSPAPRYRVADYDPRRTERFHADRSHRYVIHRDVLDADVVVSLSKLKTHEKVGVTCGLKGFVGAVGHKDCLAHHRFGSPDGGGDEYPSSWKRLRLLSRFQDWLGTRAHEAPLQAALEIGDRSVRRVLRRFGAIQGGAWSGNDTCWRMALDLARILHHADADGFMHDAPQRTHLSLIDGVVGGEGEGPLAPTPIRSGVLLFGDDVAMTDRIACRLMGFDPARIPLVARAALPMRFAVTSARDAGAIVYDGRRVEEAALEPVAGRPFEPPRGWRAHLERGR
jgi:uncharacterized protein (DUF362 family)